MDYGIIFFDWITYLISVNLFLLAAQFTGELID